MRLNAGKIVVYVFAFVFFAAGLGVGYKAILDFQDTGTTNWIMEILAALAFSGAGLAVYLLTRDGFRRQSREKELRMAHPEEPWKWRDDWECGRVRSTETGQAMSLWVFAILWNLVSAPILFVLPDEIMVKKNYAALFGLLFPLVGIGVVIFAARRTIQARKYGRCIFAMNQVPGVLGGEVGGTIVVPRGLSMGETLTVQLSSIHEEKHRSGKSTTITETVLWQAEESVVQLSPAGDAAALGGAVHFSIPYDESPTAQINANSRNLWRLQASAAVPGVDFAATFEIPVFKTQASSPERTEEELRSEEMQSAPFVASTADHPAVDVLPAAGGGTEFVIHPSNRLRRSLPPLLFFLVFAGIAVLLGSSDAPFIFPLAFGGFSIIILLLALFGAFGESRIVVEDGYVSVRNSLFGIMSGTRLPCSSIARIKLTQQGNTGTLGYFAIALVQDNGKTASLLQGISDRRQADWLAEEVHKAMEPWRTKENDIISSARIPPLQTR